MYIWQVLLGEILPQIFSGILEVDISLMIMDKCTSQEVEKIFIFL